MHGGPRLPGCLVVLFFLAPLSTGCQRAAPVAPPAAPARALAIVVSGDTAGWIVPCGCTSNQAGGLPRRATYLSSLRPAADVIYADAGGAADGASEYQRVKFAAILRGEAKMGITVHNIGAAEAALGAEELRRMAAECGVDLVSANVHDPAGLPLAPPLRIVTAGGRRVAIAGVLSTSFAIGDVQVGDPREALLSALPAFDGQFDALVVLAYMTEGELREFAAALPEADAVIGGPTGQAIAPVAVGPTLLAAATNKGKFIIRINVPPAGGWTGEVVEMGPSLADDAAQTKNLADYRQRLAQRDFSAIESGLAPTLPTEVPADYRIAGTQSCRDCHPGDCASWDSSPHAHAWATLDPNGAQADPACQKCHTTGYGLPGGFASMRDSLAATNVGCESCHGPSHAHANEPRLRTTFAARDQCIVCHDRENSPHFDFDVYWPKITHGEPAVVAEAAKPVEPGEVAP
jgi:hypothetical protein